MPYLRDGLFLELDGREQAVDIPGALGQHMLLPATTAAGDEEPGNVLEAVAKHRRYLGVGADRRGDDAAHKRQGAMTSCPITDWRS